MPLRHDIRRGALFMLGATALFTIMSTLVKLVGDRLPFTELMFFRCAIAMPVVGVIVFRNGDWGVLRTKRPVGHFFRACTGMAAMSSSFYALTLLPLAEHTALSYTTPLFVTLLSIPMLGERPGIHRWGAVLVGFAGIVVIALGQGHSAPACPARMPWASASRSSRGYSPPSPPCWCAASRRPRDRPPS